MRERSFVVLCAALLAVMPATGSAAWRQQIAGSQPLAVAVDTAGDVVAAGDGTLADVEAERCLPSAQGAQHRHDNMRVGKMRAR
jgi:type IV secretory pathway TrbF-like protein